MGTTFPTAIDNFANNTDNVDTVVAQDVNDLNDAVEALEAKVGADGSAVSSSLDYKLKNTTSGHDHDGSDSKKVIATNLNPTGLTASQLLRTNSGGTALESAGYTITTLIAAVYPIGSIYVSTASTNPNTLFGFGTWSAFGAGKVLVGINAADADFDTAEETGGAKTVTLTAAESGLPAHDHTVNYYYEAGGALTKHCLIAQTDCSLVSAGDGVDVVANSAASASSAHNNIQPYIVVYMFKRTA